MWQTHRVICASISAIGLCFLSHAQVTSTTYYGVTATEWKTVDGNMKMDYDWVRDRFVVQYQYGSAAPPKYATIDLATKTLTHFAQTTTGTFHETLLTVMPQSWNNYAQGTTFVSSGGSGNIYAIDPNGTVSVFASGLPSGWNPSATPTRYTTVRWDEYGVANNDMFYANEGGGEVCRVNSTGSIVWTAPLRLPGTLNQALPEAMIVLGANPRWGAFQNSVVVGQNSATDATTFIIDPLNGSYTTITSPMGYAPESFRVYHSRTGAPLALYVSLYGGANSKIIQLTNFAGVPNLQVDDLFIAREINGGGEIYHVYWDSTANAFQSQLIASFAGPGYFLEDMVFAPVPEPTSLFALMAGVGISGLFKRRNSARKKPN
jgi:hypothetical protein